jgi:type VI secretion system protein VasG
LARGKLRLLAATTFREYKKYMAKDPALVRRFETVQVEAPSEAKTLMIVRGLKSHYEKLQHVVVTDAAVEACVDLSTRFLPGREQPDKAIDLLDTACARAMGRQSSEPVVLQSARAQLEALRRALAALAADRDHGIDIVVSRFKDLKHDISAQEAAVSAHEIQFTTLQQDARDMQAALAARDKKALKALRQKVAKQNLSMPFEVDEHAIAEVVSNWTGVPQGKLLAQEQNVLLNLPEQLQSSIMGQDAAIKEVAQGLQLAKAQIGEPNKPMGVFLLAGPTGVGKTQTALTVADTLFGGTSHLIHINMSEFGERHSVSRLVGSPPGYVGYGEGGVLTEAVKRQPYSVVLLDEVEKAHPDVLDLFYQVFDKGELNDGEGQRVYFYNTVIFLTSNLGQDLLTDCDPKVLGTDECNAELTQELSGFFKPALLARMRTVPYVSLSDKALGSILAAKCNTIGARVKSQYQANLKFSPRLCKHVLALAKARNQGARGIEHVLNERVLSVLSQALLKSFSQTIPPKSWACDYTGKHGVVVEAK